MIAEYLLPTVQACQEQLLHPKWLICPNRRVGNQWKDQINLGGVNSVNLHSHTLNSLAIELTAPERAKSNLKFASGFQCNQILATIVTKNLAEGNFSYFSDVRSVDAIVQLLDKTVQDLRRAGLDWNCLTGDSIEVSSKANDLKIIFESYVSELSNRKLVDYSDCLSMATELVDQYDNSKPNQLLPDDLVVLCPVEIGTCRLETEFLNSLKKKSSFAEPIAASSARKTNLTSKFQSAVGEVNEVQILIQESFSDLSERSLDRMEILHTDYATYVPLLHEQLTEHLGATFNDIDTLPVTFGEGLACIYSRPGRALRSWLRWIRGDFLQVSFVKMIREGLISFAAEKDSAAIGFARLAHRFRELPIGFGRDRYVTILSAAVASAKESIELKKTQNDDSDHEPFSDAYDFGHDVLERLKSVLEGLLQASPNRADSAEDILSAATQFLNQFARSVNKFDNYAKAKLIDDIRAMQLAIESTPEFELNVWDWLENLPVESRVLASGPRPGCVHVDHVAKGGHSGRPNTFILGLDDSRFPVRGGQDPLLLDFERQAISSDLETSGARNVRSREDFRSLLSRLSGQVVLTFATQSLAADREQHPSSELIEAFRKHSNRPSAPTATVEDFFSQLGTPISFCPTSSSFVHPNQWWQASFASTQNERTKRDALEKGFSHFRLGRIAEEQKDSDVFTQYDGWVPAAGKRLDPTEADAKRTSPSRLETFGTCPRKFFFRYGLGIYPPDEHLVDHEQWLDALQLGSLLHEVFEDFLRELTKQNRIPELNCDKDDLFKLLHQKTAILLQTIPVPNQDAYERQIQRLEKTCEIFLRNEEAHCRATGAVPWILEASIGLGDAPKSDVDCAEPVAITLPDGRSVKVGGRVDRIDRIGDEGVLDFAIWDYKTGSNFGFDQAEPFKQGRKLQPLLYARMLRHRLVANVSPDAKVNYFGYFFPSPKTGGERIHWTMGDLRNGDQILSQICDAISTGAFIATENENDCKFCDYQSICGSPKSIAATALKKLESSDNRALDPIRALRGVEFEEAPPF